MKGLERDAEAVSSRAKGPWVSEDDERRDYVLRWALRDSSRHLCFKYFFLPCLLFRIIQMATEREVPQRFSGPFLTETGLPESP